jgi:hypothetical protein
MTLEQRIEKLERQNRRTKLACLLSFGIVIAGAVLCDRGASVKTFEAKEFRVVDDHGRLRARLAIAKNEGRGPRCVWPVQGRRPDPVPQ